MNLLFYFQVRRNLEESNPWKLSVRSKDHTTSWIEHEDLKESNPVELLECAKGNELQFEPAFTCVECVVSRL